MIRAGPAPGQTTEHKHTDHASARTPRVSHTVLKRNLSIFRKALKKLLKGCEVKKSRGTSPLCSESQRPYMGAVLGNRVYRPPPEFVSDGVKLPKLNLD